MQKSLRAPAAANTGSRRINTPARRLPARVEFIGQRIYLLRGQKIMLDSDLADLYRVETKALNRAVKRNLARFPEDFMFQLSAGEVRSLRCQIGTSNAGRGGRRYLPNAFTEHGVAMLSSVLNSERAVQMNILIVRAFVKLREVLATHRDLAQEIEQLARTQKDHAAVLSMVVKDIQDFEKQVTMKFKSLNPPCRRKPRIGFISPER